MKQIPKKPLIAITALLILASTATAASITSIDINYPENNTLTPGETDKLAELQIEFDENIPNEATTDFGQFPFQNMTLQNQSYTDTPNETFNADIYATTPSTYEPTEGSRTAQFYFNDALGSQISERAEINYTVESVNNWTLNKEKLNGTYSIGQDNIELGSFQATQHGNKPSNQINYNITGNITNITDLDQGSINLLKGQPSVRTVELSIDNDQQFGKYTGNLTAQGEEGQNQTIELSAQVNDDIPPSINTDSIPDLQASRNTLLNLTIEDNLDVENVSATITQVTEGENNTDIGNYTFENIEGDRWSSNFSETGQTGQYTAKIKAYDESGNLQTKELDFNIVELETVEVLETDQVFNAIHSDEDATASIINVTQDTETDLILDFWNHEVQNSSIDVEIERINEEEIGESFNLDDSNSTMTIEEAGVYNITVSSNTEESFKGTIDVQPVPPHIETSKIQFEGLFIDPEYPRPQSFSIGTFDGEIGYEEPDATVKNKIRFEGTADAEKCRGASYWRECITGFALGEYEDMRDENDKLEDHRLWLAIIAVLSWIVAIGLFLIYARKENLKGEQISYYTMSYDN